MERDNNSLEAEFLRELNLSPQEIEQAHRQAAERGLNVTAVYREWLREGRRGQGSSGMLNVEREYEHEDRHVAEVFVSGRTGKLVVRFLSGENAGNTYVFDQAAYFDPRVVRPMTFGSSRQGIFVAIGSLLDEYKL